MLIFLSTTLYFFRSITANFLSLSFPWKYWGRWTPTLGSPVMRDIKSIVTWNFVPNHRYFPWKHTNKLFTHALTFDDLLKYDIWIMYSSLAHCSPSVHCIGSLVIGPLSSCVLCSCVSFVHYGYAITSWSLYCSFYNLGMISIVAWTPLGVADILIVYFWFLFMQTAGVLVFLDGA